MTRFQTCIADLSDRIVITVSVSSPFVLTVLGPVAPASLGATHAHEHLVAHATPALIAEQPDLDLSGPGPVLEDLAAFRAAGGGAIVEMTTVDYGRDVAA